MVLFKKAADLSNWLETQRQNKINIGFVPTMGALHQGHLSLIETSRKQNHLTVASIFVNPTQFNDPKDFEKYPITIEVDIDQLERSGCDVLFLPDVKEMYPDGTKSTSYDLGFLEKIWEGRYRPGHFQGVCTIVERLLTIVQPKSLYLGQKDYQQCIVIKRLVEIMNADIEVIICPTLRETKGLAMSSRNMRLSDKEKTNATAIFEALTFAKQNLHATSIRTIQVEMEKILSGFKIDYAQVVDATTLEPVNEWDGKQKLVGLIAAYLNDVRLIDNMLLN
jgi:pantoate--beta-alanine ligase